VRIKIYLHPSIRRFDRVDIINVGIVEIPEPRPPLMHRVEIFSGPLAGSATTICFIFGHTVS
jgi:hypothetical protein